MGRSALQSGDQLVAGQYLAAVASFGISLVELFTLGAAAETRINTAEIEAAAAANEGVTLVASTGRTTAVSLSEQLGMEEIVSNPTLGKPVMTV